MKHLFTYSLILLISHTFGQQTTTLSGTFSKVTVDCGCYAMGLLNYTDEKGQKTRTYLCFDSEPGDFYEIQNGEQITVTGINKGIACSNGTTYKNIYVLSSKLTESSRKLSVPKFIKEQNKSLPVLLVDQNNPNNTETNRKIKLTTLNGKSSLNSNKSQLTEEEQKLYNLVMDYRKKAGLPPIPISSSLTTVAHLHVQDLAKHFQTNTECNTHSWSEFGEWSSCCYTSDHSESYCMWNKPKELTSYTGYGYEISYSTSPNTIATAQNSLESWKSSPEHNAVIINQNNWAKYNWKSIGIGIYKNYAVIWFGAEADK